MMRISSLLLILLLSAAASTEALAETFRDFVVRHDGSESAVAKYSPRQKDRSECFQTSTHLLCVTTKKYPQLSEKRLVQQQAQRELSLNNHQLAARKLLTLAGVQKRGEYHYLTYLNGMTEQKAFYLPSGIEHQFFSQGNFMTQVLSIPLQSALREIEERMEQERFHADYRQTLLDLAYRNFNKEKYQDTTYALKLLFNENPNDTEAYILLARTFYNLGNDEDAVQIAKNLLENFTETLTHEQSMQLGNFFLSLNMPDEAESAFGLAQERSDLVNTN